MILTEQSNGSRRTDEQVANIMGLKIQEGLFMYNGVESTDPPMFSTNTDLMQQMIDFANKHNVSIESTNPMAVCMEFINKMMLKNLTTLKSLHIHTTYEYLPLYLEEDGDDVHMTILDVNVPHPSFESPVGPLWIKPENVLTIDFKKSPNVTDIDSNLHLLNAMKNELDKRINELSELKKAIITE